ncbi:HAD family hydrolase [Candidatus Endomicrobiellum agilis]|uniref:HAD family hydrolase n=1 Tax=Candidatus Endomicrobiellum agilis TaxID=3238957 RepID=UPI00357B2EFC|nr:HAD-IA family hydrolase [Endomicrobium sp.]
MGFDFLIYDLDGTLVDSLGDIASSVNSVRKDNGFDYLSLEQVRSYVGSGVNALISKAIPGKDEKFKQNTVDSFNSYYKRRMFDTTVMFSGVKEMLESLKDKKKAILTNKTEVYAKDIVRNLGISDYFVEVWGGDTLDIRKPDPKTILELAKNTKSDLSKTVMIGDSANDFLVAKAAGVASIAVSYGYCDFEQIEFYKPDFIVKKPQEIVSIVL